MKVIIIICIILFLFFNNVFFFNNLFYDLRYGHNGGGESGTAPKVKVDNPFGGFLAWNQVKNIFKKLDKARVVDFETGLSFVVQRRAGFNHADVQPLSADDTAAMKAIYGGKWSWQRRAVIVELDGYRIAASMNGMPHGTGAIRGNNFNGHFCIHFRDSKTHSGNVDDNLSHLLMVWKAAGKVEEMMKNANPRQVLDVFITSLQNGDMELANRFINTDGNNKGKSTIEKLKKMKWIVVSKIGKPDQLNREMIGFRVKVSYGISDGTQVANRVLIFILVKTGGKIPWKVTPESVNLLVTETADSDRENSTNSADNRIL
jgi:hypothetical protein